MTIGDRYERSMTNGTYKDKEDDNGYDYDNVNEKGHERNKIDGSATPNDIKDAILSGIIPVDGDRIIASTIIETFFEQYRLFTGMEHPTISSISAFIEKVVDQIFYLSDEKGECITDLVADDLVGFYEWSIIQYMERFAEDGVCNIYHFFSGNIRLMRFYDYLAHEELEL